MSVSTPAPIRRKKAEPPASFFDPDDDHAIDGPFDPKASADFDRETALSDERPPALKLRARSAAEVMKEPRPIAVIENFAWAGCLTVLVGEPAAGKTFVMLGACAALADGKPSFGRSTRQGSIAYVSFEGDALGPRLAALSEAGFSLSNLYVIRASDPLSPRVERDGTEILSLGEIDLAAALAELAARLRAEDKPPIRLIVVDTIRASLAGSEDRSAEVSAYIRAARRILAGCPGAAGALIHHAGWQDGEEPRRRERGSSAFRGNCDATFYLEVDKNGPKKDDPNNHQAYLTLKALKVRDEERPAPLRLVLRRVWLAEPDERGARRSTCIIERDKRQAVDIEKEEARAKAEAQVKLEAHAIKAVRENRVTSVAVLRRLMGVNQNIASDTLNRLETQGRIERKKGQPYRIVPERTETVPGTDLCGTESYRTAPPIGGTGTDSQRQGKPIARGHNRTRGIRGGDFRREGRQP
jgi:hypothetical protein